MDSDDTSLTAIAEEVLFLGKLREVQVLVEYPKEQLLEESWKRVNGHTLRKDPPHFNGDTYHVHAVLSGGYEASWSVTGAKRHPSKFPAKVPKRVRDAAAKVLGVDPALLEAFWVQNEAEKVLLLEVVQST